MGLIALGDIRHTKEYLDQVDAVAIRRSHTNSCLRIAGERNSVYLPTELKSHTNTQGLGPAPPTVVHGTRSCDSHRPNHTEVRDSFRI